MPDFTKFEQYMALTEQLVAIASKEDLVETARLLAMNLAHYQSKYGELPLEETLAILEIEQTHAGTSGFDSERSRDFRWSTWQYDPRF